MTLLWNKHFQLFFIRTLLTKCTLLISFIVREPTRISVPYTALGATPTMHGVTLPSSADRSLHEPVDTVNYNVSR